MAGRSGCAVRARGAGIVVVLSLGITACSALTTPVLRPPEGRPRHEISRDMAECDEAATPGVAAYTKAAGTGFLTRLAMPFVGLGATLGFVADMGQPPDTPEDTKARLTTAAVVGGVGTAVGIIAGPFIATHEASKAVHDRRQALFERCLVARGYRPPPAMPAARVLLLVEHNRTPPTAVEAFRRELERRGYEFGRTLEVDVQWWDGPRASAGVFVKRWDIVVAPSVEAAVATQRVLPRVPIVLAGSDVDPVAAGLADSLNEPKRNVSGLSLSADELNESRLRLLLDALPHVKRIALLANPDNAGHGVALEALARGAPSVTLRRVDVRADTDLERVFRDLAGEGIEAMVVLPDRLLRRRRDAVALFALRERLPVIAGDVGFADAGGLLELHPAMDSTFRDAAGCVDRILKGAAVGSLAITTVAERDLVVNQTTAEALGLTLAERFTATATRVIR
jgi:putative tryptophan/tyrosine transport system substrate-binding protein